MIEAVFFDLDNVVYNTFEQSKECRICDIDYMIRTMHHIKIDGDKIPAIEKAYDDLMDIIKETGSNAKNHFDLLLNRYGIGGNKHVLIREAGINGFGLYSTFLHIDARISGNQPDSKNGSFAFWDNRKKKSKH